MKLSDEVKQGLKDFHPLLQERRSDTICGSHIESSIDSLSISIWKGYLERYAWLHKTEGMLRVWVSPKVTKPISGSWHSLLGTIRVSHTLPCSTACKNYSLVCLKAGNLSVIPSRSLVKKRNLKIHSSSKTNENVLTTLPTHLHPFSTNSLSTALTSENLGRFHS